MGRRHFAKKGEDVRHFRLVARSGADDDEEAAPLVLEPIATPGVMRRTGKTEAELLTIPESLDHLGAAIHRPGQEEESAPASGSKTRPRGDSEEYDELGDLDGDCYFPPDGYNYEQHLKSVSGTKKSKSVVGVVLEAPEPVKTEEIMKQPALDDDQAEVLRALENDEEYEDLEDDEMEDVVASGLAEDSDLIVWGPAALENRNIPDAAVFAEHKAILAQMKRDGVLDDDEDDDFDDGLGEFDEAGYGGGSKGSRAQVKPADDEDFEAFMADEYGDDEIGARDEDDIEGHMELDDGVLDEYLETQKAEREELLSLYEPQRGIKDDEPRVISETRAIIERHYLQEEDEEEETESGDESEDESRTWDCESVLSTLSNLSNRPGKIGKIKVIKKPAPMKPVKEAEENNEEEEDDVVELPDVVTTRPKGETAEEKKARKASVKEMRRVCRRMKKESKEMYKNEAAKLPGQTGGADVKQKTRTIKF